MSYSTDQAEAIRDYVVEKLRLILGNDEPMYVRLQAVAVDAVRDDMGTGVGHEEWKDMHRGRGGNGYARRVYAVVVGVAIVNELYQWLDEQPDSLALTLLRDILDLSDSAQRDLLGERFMPELDDVEWDEDED